MKRLNLALLPLAAAVHLISCHAGPTPRGDQPVDLAAYHAGELQYPGENWPVSPDPDEIGWSTEALAEARERFEKLDSASLMVVHRGVPVVSWGRVDRRYNVQSVRKSLLGALIGIEVGAGRLHLDATLAQLEIDDEQPSLSPTERQARVVDLLHTRSGIYHSALYEHGSWKRFKPSAGSHPPGSFWYYNNWDFNALGTIYERVAGRRIGPAFAQKIAEPLGMQEFRARDVDYLTRDSLSERILGNSSVHRAYIFMISARDLARFGLLYLSHGSWEDRQLLPEGWVRASWKGVDIGPLAEQLGESITYGYLWWIHGPQSALGSAAGGPVYLATGNRGHRLFVIPHLDLVVVHNVATGSVALAAQLKRRYLGSGEVSNRELADLLQTILRAHPETDRRASARLGQARHPNRSELRALVLGEPGEIATVGAHGEEV